MSHQLASFTRTVARPVILIKGMEWQVEACPSDIALATSG